MPGERIAACAAPSSAMTARSRDGLTQDQRDAKARQAGLASFTGNAGAEKPPRYPVRSLGEEELAHEIAHAKAGGWRDACVAEAARRRSARS